MKPMVETKPARPMISVGLPVFNGEKYLDNSIQAIIDQTYPEFTLIISDNASTDKTQEICEKWVKADERVTYTRNDRNLGAAENYNLLVDYADTDYFKWASADDLHEPAYLEKCVEILEEHPDVVMAYGKSSLIFENKPDPQEYEDGFHMVEDEPYERFKAFFDAPFLCNAIFGVMRTSVIRRTGKIGGYARSDRVLLGELLLHGKIYEVSEPLFLRRMHPERSSQQNPDDRNLAIWFNPKLRGKLTFPKWRRYSEYVSIINRTPMPLYARYRCYLVILGFALKARKWADLIGDLQVGLFQLKRKT